MLKTIISALFKDPASQYSVYIYHDAPEANRLAQWEKVGNSKSMQRAIKHARILHRKGLYKKIEIKKMFFCPQANRTISKIIRVYDRAAPSWYGAFSAFLRNAQEI